MATKPSAAKENRNLDDLVTCTICLKHFNDPRLLPCGHTYCFGCIRKAASDTNGHFMCPLKDGTTIQRNEINSLRVNLAMVEVVKMVPNVTIEGNQQQKNRAQNKQQSVSATSTNLDSEKDNDSIDTSGNPQRFKQYVIFISGLPSKMSEQRLFDALRRVFSTVGDIKINKQTEEAFIHLFRKEDNISELNGTGTITYEEEETIQKAIEKYNGKCVPILNGAQIHVKRSEMTTERPPEPLSPTRESGKNNPSNETKITVWIQIEERQATKVLLNRNFDIDDLKEMVLKGQDDRDSYQAYYRNQQLESGELVPSKTDSKEPIVLRKMAEPQPKLPPVVDPIIPEPKIPSGGSYVPTEFHIVIDNSNVFIGSQNTYNIDTRRNEINPAIRVNVINLAKVLEANKLQTDIKTRLVGGSKPPKNARVWTEWDSCGYKCILGDRSAKGKETFLDNMLHAQIYDNLLSYNDTRTRQQVLVLVTGDGNRNDGQTNFPNTVERVLKANWNVELWSWKQSLSQRFFEIQKHFPNQLTIKYLDPHRANITFEQKAKQN